MQTLSGLICNKYVTWFWPVIQAQPSGQSSIPVFEISDDSNLPELMFMTCFLLFLFRRVRWLMSPEINRPEHWTGKEGSRWLLFWNPVIKMLFAVSGKTQKTSFSLSHSIHIVCQPRPPPSSAVIRKLCVFSWTPLAVYFGGFTRLCVFVHMCVCVVGGAGGGLRG